MCRGVAIGALFRANEQGFGAALADPGLAKACPDDIVSYNPRNETGRDHDVHLHADTAHTNCQL